MKSYQEQTSEHLHFLRSMGLDVQSIEHSVFVRCHKIEGGSGRGDYAYRSSLNKMNNGYVGLVTWCRGRFGEQQVFKTYGHGPDVLEECVLKQEIKGSISNIEQFSDKAVNFWNTSSKEGRSPYLERKGVKAHGVRFRNTSRFGQAAIIPMFDQMGRIASCQILNQDGSKRMLTGTHTRDLFYKLQDPINGFPFGISESYVTAATCFECGKIPIICAFSADNLVSVARWFRKLYPDSVIFLFADNDRHLEDRGLPNKGRLAAQRALLEVGSSSALLVPEFDSKDASKDLSDWNDLQRVKGKEFVGDMIQSNIRRRRS